MFTAISQKNLANAEGYFDEHLAQNDYYAAGEIRPGQWIGAGAARLDLKNVVTRDQFHALCENRNPHDDKRLTQRQEKTNQRRVFYDFTCSAPKSVSVLAVTMDDDRLVSAHEEATRIAFRELETFAATRVRKQGSQRDRTTGNLVAAAFTHTSSRALDPLLHTHLTVFNATFDETEKRWKALQAGGMYDAIRYGTAVYRNELAKRVQQIGYRIRPAKHGFEIEGVSDAVSKRFSKRSQQRDAVVRELEQKLGRKLSNNAIAMVVHQSRAKKIQGISTAEVREQQLAQLSVDEQQSLQTLRTSARPSSLPRIAMVENLALNHAVAHVFERKSVLPEHELLSVALSHRLGAVDLEHLKDEMKHLPDLVKTERGFSTQKILATELALIQTVKALDLAAIESELAAWRKDGVQAVAVCFMNSFANPAHEQAAAALVRRAMPEAYVSVSTEVLPSIRFYERVSTTALNAYVGPKLLHYLDQLVARLSGIGFSGLLMIMQSNGGVISPQAARDKVTNSVTLITFFSLLSCSSCDCNSS